VDRSSEEEKTKNFGLLGMAWGTGFVIGPFVGGILTEPDFIFGGALTTPFWFSAALCLLNILLLKKRLEESLPSNQMAKISWMAGIHHLKKAFASVKLRSIFLMMFIFCVGWGFFTEFSPIFLMHRLGYGIKEVANFFAWVGLWIAICQGVLIRPFLKRFSPQVLLACALLGMALILPLMLFVEQTWALFALLPFLAFCESLIFPNASTLVSNLSDKEAQGEVLGIHNSIQWAAIGFAPLFSGSAVAQIPHLPITVACSAMLIAAAVFIKGIKKSKIPVSG
jgi:DHA1 family tetracycline resistance protein-like MFS transporter